jgi:CDGSH-type Zn-finger protein
LNEQKNNQGEEISIKVNKGGPYLITGNVKIIDKDGTETVKNGSVALCRCGGSQNKPYCDGSHKNKEFDD